MKIVAGLATLAVGIGLIVFGIISFEKNMGLLGIILVPVGIIVSITGLKVITN